MIYNIDWNNHIHHGAFDRILLALYTPRGIYLTEWNGSSGYTFTGKHQGATGAQICLDGPTRELDWSRSLDSILQNKASNVQDRIAFDDPGYSDIFAYRTPTAMVFAGIPLLEGNRYSGLMPMIIFWPFSNSLTFGKLIFVPATCSL